MNLLMRYGASEHCFTEATLYPDMVMARVVSQYKNLYKIVTEQGERMAEVSGKFRHEAIIPSAFPAVGDFVMIACDGTQDGNAIIHHVLTRKSVFERAGTDGQTQVVSANVDIVFICMALNNDYNTSRLERYLSVAWSSQATPVIVLTKSDLCENLQDVLVEISSIAIGVEIIPTSQYQPESYERLRAYLKQGVTAAFIGSSGVGKSTLINCLMGEEALATSAVRRDDKGRHTTTRRDLILLPQGGVVIDTPGMRGLGVDTVDLSKSFADIDALITKCRFSDCSHTTEPGCAIRAAVESGELPKRRFENFLKLKKEARYDGLSSREIENDKINTMFGGMNGMKQMRDYIKRKNKR